MLRSVLSCAAVAVVVLAAGCSRHVYSPPARVAGLESATVLDPGLDALGLEVSGHGATFGPNVSALTGRYRHALDHDLELVVEPTVMHVTGNDGEDVDTHPNIYAMRGGVKLRPWKHLSLTGGLGAGASAGGVFASPDLGVVLAYENPYFVPLLALRGYGSLPIAPESVFLGQEDGDDVYDTPDATIGASINAGFRIPLSRRPDAGSLLAGLVLTTMADEQDDIGFIGGAVALETVF